MMRLGAWCHPVPQVHLNSGSIGGRFDAAPNAATFEPKFETGDALDIGSGRELQCGEADPGSQEEPAGHKSMRVTVQLDPKLAQQLSRPGPGKPQRVELDKLLKILSIRLVPLHPGIDDDLLGSYFAVDVPDSDAAANVVKHLRPFKGVRAAYIKPPEALPR